MNILYIAYSCDPFQGSEDKIGWNIPFESSKKNNVYVITKIEHKNIIDNYMKKEINNNIHFFYVDIPKFFKKIYKGTFYSGRLSIWHNKAYSLAKKICLKYNVQIIHQITPVEFRAIGKYYKIPNIKFVVGPIGGAEYMPKLLADYISRKEKVIEGIRYLFNLYYKIKNFNDRKVKKYDYILFANKETKNYCYKNKEKSEIYSEVGITKNEISIDKKDYQIEKTKMVFIVPGRLVYRKGHLLLLDAIKRINKNLEYEVKIIGDGKYYQKLSDIIKENDILLEKVKLCGKMEYKDVCQEYEKAYALIMPSLRETTGTVLVEAISKNIPIIAYNGFGATTILSDENSYLYSGKTKDQIVENLSKKITECIENKKLYKEKRRNLHNIINYYLFETKINHYETIYSKVLNNK